ncbi:MAG: carboxypeptidase-like regulatory domain-containing protein [Paludibaculum sp.]
MKSLWSKSVLLISFSMCGAVWGQDPTGVVEGRVMDRSASMIGNAHVSVRNLTTGFVQETISSQGGLFRFPPLPVGTYTLTAEAPRVLQVRPDGCAGQRQQHAAGGGH